MLGFEEKVIPNNSSAPPIKEGKFFHRSLNLNSVFIGQLIVFLLYEKLKTITVLMSSPGKDSFHDFIS